MLLAMAGLQPFDGEIRLAGRSLSAWGEPALRHLVTLVPQRPVLLAGTIRDNLRLAAPWAPDATLIAALETVCLWLPILAQGGLDYRLGTRGTGLSGGDGGGWRWPARCCAPR